MRVRVVGGFDGDKIAESTGAGGGVGVGGTSGNNLLSVRPQKDFYVTDGIKLVVDFGVESLDLHNESIVPEVSLTCLLCVWFGRYCV